MYDCMRYMIEGKNSVFLLVCIYIVDHKNVAGCFTQPVSVSSFAPYDQFSVLAVRTYFQWKFLSANNRPFLIT